MSVSNSPHLTSDTAQSFLLRCFRAAITAVDGEQLMASALDEVDVEPSWDVLAVGKAAAAMAAGAEKALGDGIRRSLVVVPPGTTLGEFPGLARATMVTGEHPLPGRRSLAAGQAVCEFVRTTGRDSGLICLISGGSSSLIEILAPGLALPDLVRAHRWLLGSGLDIHGMNAVRCRLSRIKGGGLLRLISSPKVLAFYISDVLGDDPAVIGSGLLVPGDRTSPAALPEWLTVMLSGVPEAESETACGIQHRVVANIDDARTAAGQWAQSRGMMAIVDSRYVTGDAAAAGRNFSQRLLADDPGICIMGGEATVRLPAEPGRGGRCQQLALAAATVIEGYPDVAVLAAGTDGRDGPTDHCGAIVDGQTLARGGDTGLDAAVCLDRADAGTFLAAADALLGSMTTNTNVGDLILGLNRRVTGI